MKRNTFRIMILTCIACLKSPRRYKHQKNHLHKINSGIQNYLLYRYKRDTVRIKGIPKIFSMSLKRNPIASQGVVSCYYVFLFCFFLQFVPQFNLYAIYVPYGKTDFSETLCLCFALHKALFSLIQSAIIKIFSFLLKAKLKDMSVHINAHQTLFNQYIHETSIN